jgi:hypothetical protein
MSLCGHALAFGWLLVGFWLAFGWLLVGFWLAFGWLLVGFWLAWGLDCHAALALTLNNTDATALPGYLWHLQIEAVQLLNTNQTLTQNLL